MFNLLSRKLHVHLKTYIALAVAFPLLAFVLGMTFSTILHSTGIEMEEILSSAPSTLGTIRVGISQLLAVIAVFGFFLGPMLALVSVGIAWTGIVEIKKCQVVTRTHAIELIVAWASVIISLVGVVVLINILSNLHV